MADRGFRRRGRSSLLRHYPVARSGTLRRQKGYQNADSFISEHIAMQTLFKLLFVILVLRARKDEFRTLSPVSRGKLRRDMSPDTALPPHDAALAHMR
jgi:hypothetical protein